MVAASGLLLVSSLGAAGAILARDDAGDPVETSAPGPSIVNTPPAGRPGVAPVAPVDPLGPPPVGQVAPTSVSPPIADAAPRGEARGSTVLAAARPAVPSNPTGPTPPANGGTPTPGGSTPSGGSPTTAPTAGSTTTALPSPPPTPAPPPSDGPDPILTIGECTGLDLGVIELGCQEP